MHTRAHTQHTYTHAHAPMDKHAHTYTMHARTHTYAYIHTHAPTRTHTHTHTQFPTLPPHTTVFLADVFRPGAAIGDRTHLWGENDLIGSLIPLLFAQANNTSVIGHTCGAGTGLIGS